MKLKLLPLLLFVSVLFNVPKNLAQCAYTATVPYLESFNGVNYTNQLPTCWISSNGGACLTYTATQNANAYAHMGNQFAAFSNVAGLNYFFSNGVYLNSCVNYSLNIWYLTGSTASSNFSNLTLLIGTGQNTAGLTSLVSSSLVNAPTYTNLSTTFTVANSGVYYFAIRALCNGSAGATYLSWDDFSIEAPASVNLSPITVQVTPSVVCPGSTATLTAAGAQSFTWNNGSNAPNIVVTPTATVTYSVIGTSANNGCVYASANSTVFVPIPSFTLMPATPSVCIGKSASIVAIGTNAFLWSTGVSGAIANLSPTVNTTYTVVGTNQYGCSSTRTAQVFVLPLPTLTINTSNTLVCAGDEVTIAASGATDYTWTSLVNPHYGNTNPIIQILNAGETYSIVGTDLNGCTNSASVALTVNQCLRLSSNSLENAISVFPNPFQQDISLKDLSGPATISLIDCYGKLLYCEQTAEKNVRLNLPDISEGIYILYVRSENDLLQLKVVKE